MKKIVSIILFVAFATFGNAQEITAPEPEFIGEVALVSADGTSTTLLEKCYPYRKKGDFPADATGMDITDKTYIDKPNSDIRTNRNSNLFFIVHCNDNNSDPNSIIKIYEFSLGGKRLAQTRKLANVRVGIDVTVYGKYTLVNYTAKKYGENSYLISVPTIEDGEYGFTVNNPNSHDEKARVFYCFGVGDFTKRKWWDQRAEKIMTEYGY